MPAELRNLPKDERVWVSYCAPGGAVRYLITSRPARDRYFLWEKTEGGYIRLGKADSPGELAETYSLPECTASD